MPIAEVPAGGWGQDSYYIATKATRNQAPRTSPVTLWTRRITAVVTRGTGSLSWHRIWCRGLAGAACDVQVWGR